MPNNLNGEGITGFVFALLASFVLSAVIGTSVQLSFSQCKSMSQEKPNG